MSSDCELSVFCSICQRETTQWKDITAKIGKPAITIKDLIEKCAKDAPEDLLVGIRRSSEVNSALCFKCEMKLLEFYDATLNASTKHTEFHQLLRTCKIIDGGTSDFEKDASSKFNWDNYEDFEPIPCMNIETNEDAIDDDIEINDEESTHLIKSKFNVNLETWYCNSCKEEFTNYDVYKLHQNQMHRVYLSSRKDVLSYHTKIHESGKRFKCYVCGKGFRQEHNLTNHNRIHSDKSNYQCNECDKRFRTSSNLIRHKLTHIERKPLIRVPKNYHCDQCNKTYHRLSILNQHKITHSAVKPHICPVCTKGFAQNYNMRLHLKKQHQQYSPGQPKTELMCKICGQSFLELELLNHHLAMDTCPPISSATQCNKLCLCRKIMLQKLNSINLSKYEYLSSTKTTI